MYLLYLRIVRWLCWGSLVCLCVVGSDVLAAPATVTSIQKEIKRGYGLLYGQGKKREALRVFERIQIDIQSLLQSAKSPQARKKLLYLSVSASFLEGQASAQLKRWNAAFFAYRRALSGNPPAKLKKVIQKALQSVYKRRGATLSLSVLPKYSVIEVLYPQGWLNESHNAKSIKILHGNVTLRISHKGYKSQRFTLRVTAGKTIHRSYELQRNDPTPKRVVTPLPKRRLPPVKRPQTRTEARQGLVTKPLPSTRKKGLFIAGMATVGVAVVAAGLGGLLVAMGKAKFDDSYGNSFYLNGHEATAAKRREKARDMQIGGIAMFATGGISALVGAILIAKSSPSQKGRQVAKSHQTQSSVQTPVASDTSFSISKW